MNAAEISGQATTAVGSMARGSSLAMAGAVCQQGALVMTTLVIAHGFGGGSLGRYSLVYAMLSVIGLGTLLGFKATLTRYVAIYLADRDHGAVRGMVLCCFAIAMPLTLAVSAAMIAFAPSLSTAFHDPDMAMGIRWVAVCLPAATARDLALAALQGWRSQRAFTLIGWVYEPLARLALTGAVAAFGLGFAWVYAVLAFGSWTAALAAVFALLRQLSALGPESPKRPPSATFGFSAMSWATSLSSTGLIWADTLLLGHFADAALVGIYTVATRIMSLAIFVMAPINAAFAPHFAHHLHRQDHTEAGRLYRASTGWVLRLSAPAFAVIVLFPDELLHFFGSGYAVGASVTIILAVGQFINALTGPCGTALNMAGHVRLNLANNAAVLALNVGLNLWLIPQWGAEGAAVAWSVSLGSVNLARLVQVRRIVHTWPFGGSTARAIMATLVSAACGFVAGSALDEWFTRLLVGAIVTATAYVALTFAFGLSPEEKALFTTARRRLSA